jgi:hypothetical protein
MAAVQGDASILGPVSSSLQAAMSELGQNRKSSMRAHVFRFTPESRHHVTHAACPFRAANRRHLAATSLGRFVGVERAVERSRSCSLPV